MKKSIFLTLAASVLFFSCVTTTPEKEPENSTPPSAGQKPERPVPAIHNILPKGFVQSLEDFEEENFWQATGETDRNDFSTETGVSGEWSSDGDKCGVWRFAPVPANRHATFYCEALSVTNISRAKYICADINNTTQGGVRIFAEIETGDAKSIFRTEEAVLGIGENTNVCFDLLHGLTDEDGVPAPEILESDDVKKISFKVKGRLPGGSVYIDAIRLIR